MNKQTDLTAKIVARLGRVWTWRALAKLAIREIDHYSHAAREFERMANEAIQAGKRLDDQITHANRKIKALESEAAHMRKVIRKLETA